MAAEWFYRKRGDDGRPFGPFEPDYLRTLVTQGQLGPGDEVRKGENAPWRSAAKVGGLFVEATPPLETQDLPVPPELPAQAPTPKDTGGQQFAIIVAALFILAFVLLFFSACRATLSTCRHGWRTGRSWLAFSARPLS